MSKGTTTLFPCNLEADRLALAPLRSLHILGEGLAKLQSLGHRDLRVDILHALGLPPALLLTDIPGHLLCCCQGYTASPKGNG